MNRRSFLHGAMGMSVLPLVEGESEKPIAGVGVLRYPNLSYMTTPDEKTTSAQELAKKLAESIMQGSILALPNDRDSYGDYLWDFRIEGGDPGQVRVERQPEDA